MLFWHFTIIYTAKNKSQNLLQKITRSISYYQIYNVLRYPT
jgi:hypothetical protein